jgi:non-heme chloroperoxidase
MVHSPFVRIAAHAGGTLAMRRSGRLGGRPILFLHGYALSSAVWVRQLASATLANRDLVALDLRGHGASQPGTADLSDGATWASDIQTVLDALALDRPLVVAWSYSGLVLGDYLASGGASQLAGIVLVAAAPSLALPEGPSDDPFFGLIPALIGDDPPSRLAAERRFVRLLTSEPLDAGTTTAIEAAVGRVDSAVRQALIGRRVDHLATYAQLGIPALVCHGGSDTLLPPVVSDRLAAAIPVAESVRFPGLGHAPFLENPASFDATLDAFAGRIS